MAIYFSCFKYLIKFNNISSFLTIFLNFNFSLNVFNDLFKLISRYLFNAFISILNLISIGVSTLIIYFIGRTNADFLNYKNSSFFRIIIGYNIRFLKKPSILIIFSKLFAAIVLLIAF